MTTEAHAAFETWLEFPSLIKGGRVAATWTADGGFTFTEVTPQGALLKAFDPKTGAIAPVEAKPAAKTFPPLNTADALYGTQTWAKPEAYLRPSVMYESFPVPEMPSPDGHLYVSIRDHDVWLRSARTGRRERLTDDGALQDSWDVDSVRVVLAAGGQVNTLTVDPWAPTGLKLFVSRFDERDLAPFVRVRWNERSDEIENTYMPRAGERFPTATPYILDVHSRVAVKLDVPVDDRLLSLIGWSAEGAEVTFVQFSRDMSWAGVWRADAETGAVRLLFEEQTDSFLRIQHQVTAGNVSCTLLAEGGLIWESHRSGFDHLYHYGADGVLVRELTSGEWPVIDVQGVDEARGFVYFTAHHDPARPYDVHLCRVPLAGGAIERLTEGEGLHEIQLSPDRSYFIDTLSRCDLPPRSVVRSASGEIVHHFEPADTSALEALGWTFPEQAVVKAADGETDLWAVICKPRDFDPSKSYPVIEYIYGGPQSATAAHHFSNPPQRLLRMNQALTQLGYVVVTVDARGTPERSKRFHDAVHKDWRRHVTADHAAAIRNLAKDRLWMDLGRVGMWGHSWGGYYTFANLIDNADLYRAGVCSAPACDADSCYLYEAYLGGVPSVENHLAYADGNLIPDVDKLTGEVLLVAGTNDMLVWHSAVRMSEALICAGHPHELVTLPSQHHAYDSVHEAYFINKLVAFFDRTLQPRKA
jgi:dipeptidyl-peptidase-4